MACGCNKAKTTNTINSTGKKVDTAAVQRKIASLPLISTKKATMPVSSNKISTRQK